MKVLQNEKSTAYSLTNKLKIMKKLVLVLTTVIALALSQTNK